MQTLEYYLSECIGRDREDVEAIDRFLKETGKTIDGAFDKTAGNWPFELPIKATDKGSLSISTMAMMIRAIDLLRESNRTGSDRVVYAFDIGGSLAESLDEARDTAFAKLLGELEKVGKPAEAEGASPVDDPTLTVSPTFGRNDPLTLSFLSEVLLASPGEPSERFVENARTTAARHLKIDPATQHEEFFDFSLPANDRGPTIKSKAVSNAFVPLMSIRAQHTLAAPPLTNLRGSYLRYFETTLHNHLSYSQIPDSRFDPAELIFSLEGALRLSDQSVDVRLFDRVLDILELAQQTSAHWRPSKPFLRTEKGMVLFPVSVEAANSLLWSWQFLDQDERFHGRSERCIALFRRFWDWLAARRVAVPFKPNDSQKAFGWHSDHVADTESIQLWDTAQVVGFLLGYRRCLHQHIARTTLRLSRFDVRQPVKSESWSSETKALQQSRAGAANATDDDAADIREKFEPVSSLGAFFETYKKVEGDFLIPWLEGSPSNFSMLLYGPPGTGKTSILENLADALNFPLITITVSDFLAGGGGEVEARAKMIFDVLEAQADVVILFDEIDELVLDRSSKRHGEQDTVFKFMTPGMLTKFNNLRRRKRVIFAMATNYAYRIDPAIRRTGRIDQNYLLLPPDASKRQKMISALLRGLVDSGAIAEQSELDPTKISDDDWKRLQDASLFLGFKDIEGAVQRIARGEDDKKTVKGLADIMLQWGRTTTLRLYNKAFGETDDRDAVEREFFPLVEMMMREGKALEDKPAFDNKPLYDKEAEAPVFESLEGLETTGLAFIQSCNPEYKRQ